MNTATRLLGNGEVFQRVKFSKDDTLVVDGSPFHLIECEIAGSAWRFEGAAARTLELLAGLYRMEGDGRQFVESVFELVRQGYREIAPGVWPTLVPNEPPKDPT